MKISRVFNKDDAKLIDNFVSSSEYLQNGMIKPSPFTMCNQKVSFAYDGNLSYNSVVSKLVAYYVNECISNNKNTSYDDFYNYIQKYLNDYNELDKLLRYDEKEFEYDAYMVLKLISLSLKSNDINDFYKFYDYVLSDKSINDFDKYKNHANLDDIDSSKESLFEEFIIQMMRKYPLGYDRNHSDVSGYHYILSYLNGNNNSITRDNNLRGRIINNLSSDDIILLLGSSGVSGNDIYEMLHNYINIVIFKYIVNTIEVVHPGCVCFAINNYISSCDSCFITRTNGARRLIANLKPKDIEVVFQELGVKNIDDYVKKYINSKGRML